MFIYFTPIVSAFIGLFTNWLAVLMLFRPYKPIYLGKLKIFGIGVIPKNHTKLANKIGLTVASQLLNPQDFKKRFESDTVNNYLKNATKSALQNFFSKNHSSLSNILPKPILGSFVLFSSKLSIGIQHFLTGIFNDDANVEKFSKSIKKHLTNAYNNNPDIAKTVLQPIISQGLQKLLTPATIYEIISQMAFNKLDDINKKSNTIANFLNPDVKNLIINKVGGFSDKILNTVKDKINIPENQEKIINYLSSTAVNEIKNSEFKMILMMLPAEKLQAKLADILFNSWDKINDLLSSEKAILKTNKLLQQFTSDFINKPINQLFSIERPVDKAKIANFLANFISNFATKNLIDSHAKSLSAKIVDELPINSILNLDNIQAMVKIISKEALGFLKNNPNSLNQISKEIISAVLNIKIGRLNNVIGENGFLAITDAVFNKFMPVLVNNVPSFISALNLQQIVTQKVIEFPLPKLELIIRQVASKELKYITIFGGILGLFIGIIQVIMYLNM